MPLALLAFTYDMHSASHPPSLPPPQQEQENLRSHAWSCPQSCPICLEDFTTQPRGGGDSSGKDKGAKGSDGDEASTSASAPPAGGLDEEAGPSTSLLHSGSVNSDEEFARMSAAGQAAVRRLRQRRRAGGSSSGAASSSGGGGWAEGAGPSTAAASGTEEDGRRQRLPVTLGCGHTFCEPCIEQWWVLGPWFGRVGGVGVGLDSQDHPAEAGTLLPAACCAPATCAPAAPAAVISMCPSLRSCLGPEKGVACIATRPVYHFPHAPTAHTHSHLPFLLLCLRLEKGVTCPVCRKPISEGSGSEADTAAAQSAAAQRARIADDWLAADLAFRLGVLQT